MESLSEANARIAELEKELQKAKNKKEMSFSVSEKGCVQINGVRRFPISLYKSEIKRILDASSEIQEFISQNDEKLK
jgi:ribosome-interacting GTPase 1